MSRNIAKDGFEFNFTQNDFENLRKIVTTETGIMLHDSKKTMMYTRLVRRLREFKLNDFSSYVKYIENEQQNGKDNELLFIVNAMTTNVTAFFRESHHFDDLSKQLDMLLNKFGEVNIWSSACSSGQEPWSIAMVVSQYLETNPLAKISILATDIDSNMVNNAKNGTYKVEEDEVDSNELLRKYLNKTKAPIGIIKQATYEVDAKLKDLVKFQQMNLLKPWTILPKNIHVVFCRNVIIYFSKDTQRGLFETMSKKMPADSRLYIGHSESLTGVTELFTTKGSTTYIRNGE